MVFKVLDHMLNLEIDTPGSVYAITIFYTYLYIEHDYI